MDLVALEEYEKLTPRQQGYVVYLQAELPGSGLRGHQGNPYPPGSRGATEWDRGARVACLQVQDAEE